MRKFTGIWKKNSADSEQIKYLERNVLESALLYAEHLVLPEPSGKAVAYLTEQKRKTAAGDLENEKRYCIRFLSDGTKAGDLDAGYLAGQIASFLRFQGNAGIKLHRITENGKNKFGDLPKPDIPWKMNCRAVLTSGEHERTGRHKKHMFSDADPGIYTEKRDNWSEELLAYTRQQYPGTYRRLNSRYKDGWIHFSEKRRAGIHSFADAFDAGLAAAQIMAAAEVLWVELELSQNTACGDTDYLFSVRRKEIKKKRMMNLAGTAAETAEEEDTNWLRGKETAKDEDKETEKLYPGKILAGFGSSVAAGVSV